MLKKFVNEMKIIIIFKKIRNVVIFFFSNDNCLFLCNIYINVIGIFYVKSRVFWKYNCRYIRYGVL